MPSGKRRCCCQTSFGPLPAYGSRNLYSGKSIYGGGEWDNLESFYRVEPAVWDTVNTPSVTYRMDTAVEPIWGPRVYVADDRIDPAYIHRTPWNAEITSPQGVAIETFAGCGGAALAKNSGVFQYTQYAGTSYGYGAIASAYVRVVFDYFPEMYDRLAVQVDWNASLSSPQVREAATQLYKGAVNQTGYFNGWDETIWTVPPYSPYQGYYPDFFNLGYTDRAQAGWGTTGWDETNTLFTGANGDESCEMQTESGSRIFELRHVPVDRLNRNEFWANWSVLRWQREMYSDVYYPYTNQYGQRVRFRAPGHMQVKLTWLWRSGA